MKYRSNSTDDEGEEGMKSNNMKNGKVLDGERVYVHGNNARVYVQHGHWQHIVIVTSQHHSQRVQFSV